MKIQKWRYKFKALLIVNLTLAICLSMTKIPSQSTSYEARVSAEVEGELNLHLASHLDLASRVSPNTNSQGRANSQSNAISQAGPKLRASSIPQGGSIPQANSVPLARANPHLHKPARLLSERLWNPKSNYAEWFFRPKIKSSDQGVLLSQPLSAYAINPFYDPSSKVSPLLQSLQPYIIPEDVPLRVEVPQLPEVYREATPEQQLKYQNAVVRARVRRLIREDAANKELLREILDSKKKMILAQIHRPYEPWKSKYKHYTPPTGPLEVFVDADQLNQQYESIFLGPGREREGRDSEPFFEDMLGELPTEAQGAPPDARVQAPSSGQAGTCDNCDRNQVQDQERSGRNSAVESLQQLSAQLSDLGRGNGEPPGATAQPSNANVGAGQDWKEQYANAPEVLATLRYAVGQAGTDWLGYCFRAVKQALVAGGMVGEYWSSQAARDAATDLSSRGYVNLLNGPHSEGGVSLPQITDVRDAPEGAVLVFEGGENRSCDGGRLCGHVEIKSGPGYTAVSEVIHDRPMNPEKYRLVGVMIKPSLLQNN